MLTMYAYQGKGGQHRYNTTRFLIDEVNLKHITFAGFSQIVV